MPGNEEHGTVTRQMGTGHTEPATEKKQFAVVIGLCLIDCVWLVSSGAPAWWSLLFAATILLAAGLAVAGLWPVVVKKRAD